MAENPLARDIAARLRRAILRGELPPGAPLKERDNAAALGVSRTPFREAVRILAQEGLVTLRPARSPIVAQPGIEEVADQIEVLTALETLAGTLACTRATQAELDGLRTFSEDLSARYDALDPLDFFEQDMDLHHRIVQAAHNGALAQTHRAYLDRLWRVRFLSARQRRNRDRVRQQHAAIVEALAARDPDAVRAAIDAHLGPLTDHVRPILLQEQQAASA